MRALVLIRGCVDARAMLRITPDEKSLAPHGLKIVLNPFDEVALEMAIQAREQEKITHISAIAVGGKEVPDALRHALAMGADDAVHVQCDTDISPVSIIQAVAVIARRDMFDVVMLGKENPDDGFGTEGAMLAALLGWPCIPVWDGTMPCIVAADLTHAVPRRVLLPQIIAARSRPVQTCGFSDLDLTAYPPLKTLSLAYPAPRPPSVMLHDFDALCRVIEEAIA